MEIIIIIFLSYICGSIPFGLILTKLFSDLDLRNVGSGNIGATNVFRTGNKYLALLTLILDILKGYFPVIIAQKFFPEYVHLSGLLAFLGHVFPVWLKFKGGKGVATYLGILCAISYALSILFIFTWLITILIFKYASVSSLFSSLTIIVVTFIRETTQGIIITKYSSIELTNNWPILFIFFILIVFTHKKNISNLINKTEQKIKI